jgi:DNA modification methylase
VLDPFAGTGTTLVVAGQSERKSIGIEIDPDNVKCIKDRVRLIRETDDISKYYKDYIHTENLHKIWDVKKNQVKMANKPLDLFAA